MLTLLCLIRFGPEILAVTKKLTKYRRGVRKPVVQERLVAGKPMTLEEERALYKRVIEARKRQIL